MNLTELIRLNNQLQKLTTTDIQQSAVERISLIMHETDVPGAGVDNIFRDNIGELNEILQNAFTNFENELTEFKREVQRQIEYHGNEWLQKSYIVYEQDLESRNAQKPEALEYHKNKPVQISDELAVILKTRVASYCGWKYPAMIIHPMMEPFIHGMVSCDPLYVVDESYYLLESTLKQFNEVYQRRLRTYIIEESFEHPLLARLPDQQLGFCLAYNYFNYRPFEIIKKYFEEIYQKLSPGGVFALTFNDCDHHHAMSAVEQNLTSYTPGTLVRGWAKYVGFEEIFYYQNDEDPSVWLELKKPGELTSLRGGQAMAKILPKTIANSK
jgi:SAM-dependent methyltransferase